MSLLEEAFEDFQIMNKSVVDDGYGGIIVDWSPGAKIKGAMVFDGSAESRVAQALGSSSSYTFTCRKNLTLDYHDILMRLSDEKLFRLTSNSDDLRTPPSAGLDMRQYSAEQLSALPK